MNDLITVMHSNDLFCVNWACFGPTENENADWVIERFLHRKQTQDVTHGTFKTLIQNPNYFSWFLPHAPGPRIDKQDVRILHDCGDEQSIAQADHHHSKLRRIDAKSVVYKHAQINHYITKSKLEFLLRMDRGRGSKPKGETYKLRHGGAYFASAKKATVQDESILKRLAGAQKMARSLLSDSEVARCYFTLKQLHRRRLKLASENDIF